MIDRVLSALRIFNNEILQGAEWDLTVFCALSAVNISIESGLKHARLYDL
jgi:hypothetical protein